MTIKTVYNTKKRLEKKRRAKWFILLSISSMYLCVVLGTIEEVKKDIESLAMLTYESEVNKEVITPVVNNGTIREITMYNSLPEQTDDTPCISADGTDICKVDYNVCATNAFPLGTKLYVDKLGECIVRDRMNSRYSHRIDWYAKMDKDRAIKFGLQNLIVSTIN